jgi:transposase
MADTERYRLARLLMTSRSRLDAAVRVLITHLLDAEPALDVAITWAKRPNKLL